MPEQTELVNYYLQSLQDNLAHVVKEKALDEAKLNFKDVEIGEIKKGIEERDIAIKKLTEENANLVGKTRELETAKLTSEKLEKKLQESQKRLAEITEKMNQAHRKLKDQENEIEWMRQQLSDAQNHANVINEAFETMKAENTELKSQIEALSAIQKAKAKTTPTRRRKKVVNTA